VLSHEGYKVDTMGDGKHLVAQVREDAPDLVLLDIMLPEISGLELCGDLRMLEEARAMPIILVTSAFLDEESVVRGLLAGADDYIVSPFRLAELRARIRVQLRNCRDRELLQLARAQGASLKSAAMTDALTGLANRRAADEVLDRALGNRERVLAVLIDIDHFKQINDTYGHAAGDVAIVGVADAIKGRTRRGDLAARYGGDEFLVIVQGAGLDVAGRIGERYLDAIRRIALPPLPGAAPATGVAAASRSLTVSIGIAGTASDTPVDRASLLAAADRALYEAKRAGRNGVSVPGGT
jgi:diguanylate cyclase (GGDEF)-like protein